MSQSLSQIELLSNVQTSETKAYDTFPHVSTHTAVTECIPIFLYYFSNTTTKKYESFLLQNTSQYDHGLDLHY